MMPLFRRSSRRKIACSKSAIPTLGELKLASRSEKDFDLATNYFSTEQTLDYSNGQDTSTTLESRDSFISADPVKCTLTNTRSHESTKTAALTANNKSIYRRCSSSSSKITLLGTELYAASFGHHRLVQNPFDVNNLVDILETNTGLLCLELYKVELRGDPLAFKKLSDAIEKHGKLRALSLEQCRLTDVALTPGHSFSLALDPVVVVLARGPILRDLTLVAEYNGALGGLSSSTLELLGRSSSLHSLRLCRMNMDSYQMTALTKTIKSNRILRTLKLSFHLCPTNTLAVESMLAENRGLESLEVVLDTYQDEKTVLHIARVLQAAAWLKHYDLILPKEQAMTKTLIKAMTEVKEGQELAKEMAFSSTSLSNCPFIRMFHQGISASLELVHEICF